MTVVALIIAVPRGLRRLACVVRFGSGRNKFVQLLIRSRNSSGRFVRSLILSSSSILLATLEADWTTEAGGSQVSYKYSLLINIDKTQVMASNSTACCIHIQNEQLEQVDMFPYLGSLITEEGECTTKFRTRLNKGQMIRASLQNLIESMRISCTISIYYRLKLKKVTWQWPRHFQGQFVVCRLGLALINMHAKFEVSSLNRSGDI